MLRLLPLILFLLPAAWATWLVGMWLREGLAALLYYRLADLTPLIITHHDNLAWLALGLAAAANLLLLAELELHRVKVGLIAALSLIGGILWMATALVQPDWWLAPTNGLLMFTVVNTPMLAVALGHVTFKGDDILPVLLKIAATLAVVAVFQAFTSAMLPY